jgi:hypothetical protein
MGEIIKSNQKEFLLELKHGNGMVQLFLKLTLTQIPKEMEMFFRKEKTEETLQ